MNVIKVQRLSKFKWLHKTYSYTFGAVAKQITDDRLHLTTFCL